MPGLNLTPSAGAVSALPDHAGDRAHLFDAERCVYNWKQSNTRRLKAALGLGGYWGATKGAFLVYGDSASEAQVGTNAWNHQFSWPSILQQCLTAGGTSTTVGAGGVMPGGYTSFFGSSGINGFDVRVAKTGTWTNSTNGYVSGAVGATMTFPQLVSGVALQQVYGSAVDVAYEYVAGSGFTVAIDGGAAVAVPMTGSGYKHYTVTGLTDGPHSVVITVTGAAARIMSVSVYRPGGFQVHNLSRSGATAQEFGTGAVGGLREHRLAAIPPLTSPGAALIKLGANDLNGGRTAAQVITSLQELKTSIPALDVVLMNYNTPQTPSAEWLPLLSGLYDLADEWDCPLVDVADRIGPWAEANTNGLISGDGNHPNTRYHGILGAAVADLMKI